MPRAKHFDPSEPYRVTIKNKHDECRRPRCDEPIYAEGLCSSHYQEWTLRGRPPFVDATGRVYKAMDGQIAPPPLPSQVSAEFERQTAQSAYETIQRMALDVPGGVSTAQQIAPKLQEQIAKIEGYIQDATGELNAEIQRRARVWEPALEGYRKALDLLQARLVTHEQIKHIPPYRPETVAPTESAALAPTSSGHPPPERRPEAKKHSPRPGVVRGRPPKRRR